MNSESYYEEKYNQVVKKLQLYIPISNSGQYRNDVFEAIDMLGAAYREAKLVKGVK